MSTTDQTSLRDLLDRASKLVPFLFPATNKKQSSKVGFGKFTENMIQNTKVFLRNPNSS